MKGGMDVTEAETTEAETTKADIVSIVKSFLESGKFTVDDLVNLEQQLCREFTSARQGRGTTSIATPAPHATPTTPATPTTFPASGRGEGKAEAEDFAAATLRAAAQTTPDAHVTDRARENHGTTTRSKFQPFNANATPFTMPAPLPGARKRTNDKVREKGSPLGKTTSKKKQKGPR